jgi:hypothetical protein
LKKKTRFGLFFKKKLSLTSDHKLYYTDKKDTKAPKYIPMRPDRIKIERVSNTKFKILTRELQKITSTNKNSAQFKDKIKIFKCSDKKECEMWITKILETVDSFSIIMSSIVENDSKRTTADFTSALATRH